MPSKDCGGADEVDARAGSDRVLGGDGGDILQGGGGRDTLNAGPNPSNTLEGAGGGAGSDTLVESAGPDRYFFDVAWGHDQITGDGDPAAATQDHDDVCFVCSGGPSTDLPLTIDLAAGTASDGTNTVEWTAPVIEDATGGYGGDTITGNGRYNVINGFLGADTIDVSGDDAGAGDFVNCGDDSVTDTVTKDPQDDTRNCESDNVTNAQP